MGWTKKQIKNYKYNMRRSFLITLFSITIVLVGFLMVGIVYERINYNFFGSKVNFIQVIDKENIKVFENSLYLPLNKIKDGISWCVDKLIPSAFKIFNLFFNYIKELLA